MGKIILFTFFSIFLHSAIWGQTIPVIDFQELNNVLKNGEDKVYVINFWATWCAPCVKELPDFERLNKEFKDKNVTVLLISLDFPKQRVSKLEPFVKKKELTSEVLLLDEADYNSWIDIVCEDWEGAIPATVILKGSESHYVFIDGSTDYKELLAQIKPIL